VKPELGTLVAALLFGVETAHDGMRFVLDAS